MDRETLVLLFNEWMRRYTEAPDQFAREWQDVQEFLAAEAAGEEPSYGRACVEYLERLQKESAGKAAEETEAENDPELEKVAKELKPRCLHDAARLNELKAAIHRYVEARRDIPWGWAEELLLLVGRAEKQATMKTLWSFADALGEAAEDLKNARIRRTEAKVDPE